MNYFKQLKTVAFWEYQRFYKLKNELIGIAVLIIMGLVGGSVGAGIQSYAEAEKDITITITDQESPELKKALSEKFTVDIIDASQQDDFIEKIKQERKGLLLCSDGDIFMLHAYKEPRPINDIQNVLDTYRQNLAIKEKGISTEQLDYVLEPAEFEKEYYREEEAQYRTVAAYVFVVLMIMAVFSSFAYQFTGITGEKQLKVTEMIVSAIKPKVWMDGKIVGITLTGLSSMLSYLVIAILGGIVIFILANISAASVLKYIHLPSIILFFLFTIMGILMWNAFMAAIASIITDPNNSGKSSIMFIPVAFVLNSFFVISYPESNLATFFSWFPLTSPSTMPILWSITDIALWQLAGSFIVLTATFYLLRTLAAKIFRVSILISGNEPSWGEVFRLAWRA